MYQKQRFLFLVMLLCFFLLATCSKDDDDCGCNGPTQLTYEDSDETTGFIYLNDDEDNPNSPDYDYIIYIEREGSIINNLFVCNEIALFNIQPIPIFPGKEVSFSGLLKKPCSTPRGPAINTYNTIVLTKINE